MNELDALLNAFDDESWRVRKEAVSAAADWPRPDEVVAKLLPLLGSDVSVAARGAALEALAAIGEPAVAPLSALVARKAPERKFAIDVLAEIGSPVSAPVLVAALDDEDENVRATAAEALAEIGRDLPDREAASQALRRQLGRGELLGRLSALSALSRLEERLPLAEVLPLLDEAVLRPAALVAAGRSGDLEALPHLLVALAQPGRGTRAAALVALDLLHDAQPDAAARGRIAASLRASPPPAVAAVVAALGEGALPARRAAARVAGWGRWPAALPGLAATLLEDALHEEAAVAIAAYGAYAVGPLVALADSSGTEQRREIIAVLPRLGAAAADRRVAELCERALADEGGAAAAAALGEIGGKDTLPALVRALDRADDELVAAAGEALARLAVRFPDEARLLLGARRLEGPAGAALCRVLGVLRQPADRTRVLAALHGGEPPVRAAAAGALGALGGERESVDALIFALADEDAAVRAAAAEALGRLGAPAAAAALAGATTDADVTVAGAATRALGRLGGAEAAVTLRRLASTAGAATAFALEGLAALGDPVDDARLATAAAHADPEIAKAAVRGLAGRARPAPLAALRSALDHARWDVRRAAAQALANVAEPEAREALRARAAVERDPMVREALTAALA